MVQVPAAFRVRLQLPLPELREMAAGQDAVPPPARVAVTSTLPSGVPLPAPEFDTVTLTATDCPTTEGAGVTETPVLVGILLTVWVIEALLPSKLALPE